MKKLIYLMILICSLSIVGCSESSDGSGEDVTDNGAKVENQEKEKKSIDISEMIPVLRPTLKMMSDGTTYDELFEDEGLSWLTYAIIWDRDMNNESDVSLNEVGNDTCLIIDKNDMNKHLKAINADFDDRIVSDIITGEYFTLKYLFEADMYAAMPADGAPLIDVKVLDAYDNGDGTYSATVTAQLVYDMDEVDSDAPVETYKVSLVKNETSDYKYSITNIEK